MQGIVLTSCASIGGLLNAIRSNKLPLLKVVTGWGAHWDESSRREVCRTMPELIVRTVSGDGTRGPPEGQSAIWCDPGAVLEEVQPWYDARASIQVELGNEPNGYDASDDAAWNFRYWFLETVATVRAVFPAARIVAPGLIEDRQSEWWAICQDAFEQADAIGVHAYAYHDFTNGDTGQIQRALSQLATFFPAKSWILTECGINDPGTSPETKATRYAALHAKLPSQVSAACWYHLCSAPSDADQAAYQLPPEALPYLYAGGTL
jgi:hypothetical protein